MNGVFLNNNSPPSNFTLTAEDPYKETHQKMFDAIIAGNAKSLEEVLKIEKYDIDHRDENGQTFLHLAASRGHIRCIQLLIEYKAVRDIRDNFGNTPDNYAPNDHVERVLLNYTTPTFHEIPGFYESDEYENHPINKGDDEGKTLLMLAVIEKDTKKIDELLADPFIHLNLTDKTGNSALSHAIKEKVNMEVIEKLHKKGADIEGFQDDDQRTLLMLAMTHPEKEKLIPFLIENGLDKNDRDIFGFTPLFYAVNDKNCARDFIISLIQDKFVPEDRNQVGETVAMVAAKSGCKDEVLELLATYTAEDFKTLQKIRDKSRDDSFKILNFTDEHYEPRAAVVISDVFREPQQFQPAYLALIDILKEHFKQCLEGAIKKEGTLTQFDLIKGNSMCGCAAALAILSLLKSDQELDIDAILKEALQSYYTIIYNLQFETLTNPTEDYSYGKFLNWSGDILPFINHLSPLSNTNRIVGNFTKLTALSTYKMLFEELLKKIPQGETKLGASLLLGHLFFGIVIRKEESGGILLDFFDSHGCNEPQFKNKAYWIRFNNLEKAVGFLMLRFNDLIGSTEYELSPVIYDAKKVSEISYPVPKEEEAAILLAYLAEDNPYSEQALNKLRNEHPEHFKALCHLLNPAKWLEEVILHPTVEMRARLMYDKVIDPFLSAFRAEGVDIKIVMEKKISLDYAGNRDLMTKEDINALSFSKLDKYSEENKDLIHTLSPTEKYQRSHQIKRYNFLHLRKERNNKYLELIDNAIVEMQKKLSEDMDGYVKKELYFRSERSLSLSIYFDLVDGFSDMKKFKYLTEEQEAKLKEMETKLSETLETYFKSIITYVDNNNDEIHLQMLELENKFIKTISEKVTLSDQIKTIFHLGIKEGEGTSS